VASHPVGHNEDARKNQSGKVLLQSVTLAFRTGGVLVVPRKELTERFIHGSTPRKEREWNRCIRYDLFPVPRVTHIGPT